MVRARGDLWGFGRDVARGWGADRTQADVVAILDREAASRRMPVVTTTANILLDVLVHSQDIAVPLDIDHPVPTDAGLAAFHRIWSMGWPFHARKRLAGVTLAPPTPTSGWATARRSADRSPPCSCSRPAVPRPPERSSRALARAAPAGDLERVSPKRVSHSATAACTSVARSRAAGSPLRSSTRSRTPLKANGGR